MRLNGEETEVKEEMSIGKLLEEKGYRRERVAVELNGEILPKNKYDDTMIKNDDVIEVVSFVGGG
ncbi:MAG: sulfur carrier protein ThiS [Firmicutes bacterium]|nr:sulfur carrier protein ThiS [Bacillota bacterium]